MLLKRKPTAWGVLFLVLSLCLTTIAYAQNRTVTGKILGEDKKPIGGVTVSVKGTSIATETDANGNFSINVPSGRNVLSLSSVGYQSQDVTIGNSSTISATMVSTASSLNEVVVTGYTAQRKKDITGSVSVVNVAEMKQTPVGTGEEALQGRASGLTVISSAQPGGASDIRIR